jgi:hypothetical protein
VPVMGNSYSKPISFFVHAKKHKKRKWKKEEWKKTLFILFFEENAGRKRRISTVSG